MGLGTFPQLKGKALAQPQVVILRSIGNSRLGHLVIYRFPQCNMPQDFLRMRPSHKTVYNLAGKLLFLQSALLMRRIRDMWLTGTPKSICNQLNVLPRVMKALAKSPMTPSMIRSAKWRPFSMWVLVSFHLERSRAV